MARRRCAKGQDDEAQRDQRQSGRALPRQARRARHRLGQGQDLRPRRQGPDRAHRASRSTASRAARRRCIAACPSAASTTRCSSKNFKVVNLGRLQEALDAGQARAPRRTVDGAALVAAGHPAPVATACGCWPRASCKADAHDRGRGRLEGGDRRGREGRRQGRHAAGRRAAESGSGVAGVTRGGARRRSRRSGVDRRI